jgi:hypothetical protein
MTADREGAPEADPLDDDGRIDLYDTRILLPLIVGIATLLAGVVLLEAGHGRPTALLALLETGVALLVIGIVLYFVIGLWLIPGSIALGGVAFLAAFELESHASQWALGGGVVWAAVGLLGVAKALAEVRRRPVPGEP